MKLEWTMFANYAQETDGLLYIMGGTWDTIQVSAPLEGGPPDAVAVIQGTLIVRLLVHQTETDKDHTFEFRVVDEDGGEQVKVEGSFKAAKNKACPDLGTGDQRDPSIEPSAATQVRSVYG